MKFTLLKEKCSLVDNQKIEIQEIPERVPSGAQPSTGMVILEGDLVNKGSSRNKNNSKYDPKDAIRKKRI